MEIRRIAIAGAGALGTMYARQIVSTLGRDAVMVVTDPARKKKYEENGIFANGSRCGFRFSDGNEDGYAELVLFAVKFGGLESAMANAAPLIGPDTVIFSVMNGITSEEILAERFGSRNILLCTAQGMDATRTGNHTVYQHIGNLWLGAREKGQEDIAEATADFLRRAGIPVELASDMPKRLWKKLMMNVGVNQVTSVYECGYGGVKQPGEARDVMAAAMRETMLVANAEGIPLREEDVSFWLDMTKQFDDNGLTSMRQDLLAGRETEVELFAGTIRALAKKHGLSVPVNDLLYKLIKKMEER